MESTAGRDGLEHALQRKFFSQLLQVTVRAQLETYNGDTRSAFIFKVRFARVYVYQLCFLIFGVSCFFLFFVGCCFCFVSRTNLSVIDARPAKLAVAGRDMCGSECCLLFFLNVYLCVSLTITAIG